MTTTRTWIKVAAGTLGVAAASSLLLWYVSRDEESDDVEEKEQVKIDSSKQHYSSRRAATRNRLPRPRPAAKLPGKEPRISARIAAARRNCIPAFSKVTAIAEQLRSRGKRWSDERFPTAASSLYSDASTPPAKDWLRRGEDGEPVEGDVEILWQPPEHFSRRLPRLGVKHSWIYAPMEVKTKVEDRQQAPSADTNSDAQGCFGNCYFLCALAGAVRDIQICDDIIDCEFENCGMYGVSFWLHNKWQMVWVDSFFPCWRPGKDAKEPWRLIFPHGEAPQDEIWSLLVEKAFAKIQGSYEAVSNCSMSSALSLLTGCEAESLDLHSPAVPAEQIFDEFILARPPGMVLCACSRLDVSSSHADGIIPGHGYRVLDATATSVQRFLKLRNPCGGSSEWQRDCWHGEEAQRAAQELGERRECNADEFWMELADVIERFQTIDWCAVDSEELEDAVSLAKKLGKLQAPSKPLAQSTRKSDVDERDVDDLVKDIESASKKRTPRYKGSKKRGGRV